MSTTLSALKATLFGSDGTQGIIQDSSYYSSATSRINDAVTAIAAGVRMPNGQISPPLPELYASTIVSTATDAAYKALPANYMRSVFMVVDENGHQIYPPMGGSYYDFALFLRHCTKKDLTQAGAVSSVVVKGNDLYYQGIPSASYDLTVHYYRKPTDMSDDTDTVDGLPDQFASRLIKAWVAKEIYSELEDGEDNQGVGYKIWTAKFFEVMTDFVDFIGITDATPEYYGQGQYQDLGVVD